MILEYLKEAGKYIYGNRILMVISTLVVFIVIANLLKFISNIQNEHFDNHGNTNNTNKNNTNKPKLDVFMQAQLDNMTKTNKKK
jgi:F0F1-type ATP synthase membrane subunit a